MLHQKDLKAKWNEYANLTTARNEGVREGIETGIKTGIETGVKKGKAEAEKKSKTTFVKNLLLKMNLSDEQAAEIAEVPVDFVKKVRKTLK